MRRKKKPLERGEVVKVRVYDQYRCYKHLGWIVAVWSYQDLNNKEEYYYLVQFRNGERHPYGKDALKRPSAKKHNKFIEKLPV